MTPSERTKFEVLKAEHLVKSFNGRRVVDNVSIDIKRGEIVGLLGPNGAGKSTTFYMMIGRIMPESGRVFNGEKDITALPMYERARTGLGYLPQEASVFRKLTVRQNLELVLEEAGMEKEVREEKIEKLLTGYGLKHIENILGISLSGGERRRVEIARCLALDPSFILLDEPFSGIDPIAVADLQAIIRELKEKGYGILLTDHNVRETLSITDRAYLIHQGKVFLEGLPGDIAKNEEARKFYLGADFCW
ncbi:MAG TPA: LPS export ABC transporter ATP-binding protein [Synergistaceae bacterium]|jgi:lipopolysaccharide export system ATP-binding protein|nr:LPS export ABC transporter ATP-binding protein [Synergistaceae bacterium]NLL41292.1 LPS export ABC transporter ATP-binding protein [Synergistaceae bacterium]HPX03182.1 LPS export ABC transporter ATP-binding protein [Synergistaceae bacterium]HQA53958.1 LPS export ABC transporter ATP-binding protein [Synergistaceae bacterium]